MLQKTRLTNPRQGLNLRPSGFPYRPGEQPRHSDHGETGIPGCTWRRWHPRGVLLLNSLQPDAKRRLWELIQQLDPDTAKELQQLNQLAKQLEPAFGPLPSVIPLSHAAVKQLQEEWQQCGRQLAMTTKTI